MSKQLYLPLLCFIVLALLSSLPSIAQQQSSAGEIHGDFQIDAQYYNPDSAIGAPPVPEKVLMNGIGNLIFTKGKFSAGVRFESYLNALQGIDPRFQGIGIPYRFATYRKDDLEITVGNFYEQFGSGMVLRTYEDRFLGFDNSLDGARVKYELLDGIRLTGLIGKQRTFFDRGPGIVRGFDGEINLNETVKKWKESKNRLILGGSFVSKYQADQDPVYMLPENVGASAARLTFIRGGVSLMGEYAYKINDPTATNGYIYKPGEAVLVTASYSQKGLGIVLSAKRTDNFDFRSDRTSVGNNLVINYLPALTKQHTYNLAASIYPYAIQPNGEMAIQGELTYNIERGSKLGGKYGTTITVNYSAVNGLDTTTTFDGSGYETDYFSTDGEPYFRDFNIEINRKLNKKWKVTAKYLNLLYNKDVIQGLTGFGTIHADIGIVDVTYKLARKHALRMEMQGLFTEQDEGDWAHALLEYTFAPHFFVAFQDQYNYGNEDPDRQIHYVTGTVGYLQGTTRITLTYGRQRAGIFCVGGVCRNVPASNGIALSVATSF